MPFPRAATMGYKPRRMLVSVIVPCFNHGRFVVQCLRSIDAQDHPDLEVIVIDDGSTDDTWEMISSYRWGRARTVRTIRTGNRGAHAALNEGLTLARGDWIALCNSDDCFAPTRLSRLIAAARGTRFLFSNVRYIDEAGRDVTERWPYARELKQKQQEIRSFPSVGYSLVLTNTTISTGNFFFHRSLIEEVGYFRPYRYCHDWDFVLRALLFTEPVYLSEALYSYRLHPRNSFRSLQEAAARECPELMRRFLKATVGKRWPNRLAPSPHNWPGFFQVFIDEHRYQPYLTAWEYIDGPFYPVSGQGVADVPAAALGALPG